MKIFRFAAIGLASVALVVSSFATAQTQRVPTAINPAGQPQNSTPGALVVAPAGGVTGKGRVVSEDNGLPIKGTITASFAPFTPLGAAVLAVTTSTGLRVALPTGPNYVLTNNGSADMTYLMGSSSVQALSTSFLLPAGRSIALASPVGATHISAITATGSTSLSITGGTGIPVISGGGGTGGGGGAGDASAANQTTQITAANLTNTELGALGLAACTTDNGASCALNQLAMRGNQRLTAILAALGSPFQAGGSIGNTSFGISGTLPPFASPPAVTIGGSLPPYASPPLFNCGTGCTGATPFAPDAALTSPLSATISSARIAFAGAGTTAVLTNTGTVEADCNFGSSSVTAATGNAPLLPGVARVFDRTGMTNVACITPTGTTTIKIETGSGAPTFGVQTDLNATATVTGTGTAGTSAPGIVTVQGAAGGVGVPVSQTGPVNLSATSAGGCVPFGYITTASTNSANPRNVTATWCGGFAVNPTGTIAYLRLYDATTSPTCSSAVNFKVTIPVPANTAGAGTVLDFGPFGAAFPNGIAWCVTGGGSSTDNTNAPAGVYIILGYK